MPPTTLAEQRISIRESYRHWLYELTDERQACQPSSPLRLGIIFFSLPAIFFLLRSTTLSFLLSPMPSNRFTSTLFRTSPSFK